MSFRRGHPERTRLKRLGLLPGPFVSRVATGSLNGNRGEALTFTRATAKTVETSSSTVASVASGNPVVGSKGLLIEATHTNAVNYSEELESWQLRGTCVITPGFVSPRGDTTARRVSGVQDFVVGDFYVGGSGPSASDIAVSMWMRRVSTTGSLRMITAGGDPGEWYIDLALLSSNWERVTAAHPAVTIITPFTGEISHGLDIMRHAGASPLSFDLWGVQTEAGTYVHSYAGPTTNAPVACNADLATMSGAALPITAGTLEVSFTPLWSTSAGCEIFDTRAAGPGPGMALFVASDNTLAFATHDGSGQSTCQSVVGLDWVAGQTYRIRAAWGAGNIFVYRDNVLTSSIQDGSAHMPSSHDNLRIGRAFTDGFLADGSISDLAFYDY